MPSIAPGIPRRDRHPADAGRGAALPLDKRPDRRARLVDELLERPEFADYWALKWADLLRVDRQALGHKRAYAYYQWIRESIAANKPYDQFAREVILAEGPLAEVGPANFYKAVPKPGEAASTLSQVFLGCALPVPSAIIIRSTVGARPTITA